MSRDLITYDRLAEVAESNRRYLGGEYDGSGAMTADILWRVQEELRQRVPQVRGGFGVGFPFHSTTSSGELVANPEFDSYNLGFIDTITKAKQLSRTALWECSPCQTEADFTPTSCSDCTLTTLKPREVMKAMPDVDMFIVCEDISPATLATIQDAAIEGGFTQSDFDATGAIKRIGSILDSFADSAKPADYFPVDIHAVQEKPMIEALQDIAKGETDITIPIRSMYAGWKRNEKIDFWFDFVFSGTFSPDACSEEVMQAVTQERNGLTEQYSNEAIESLVRQKSLRADVLLDYSDTRQVFLDKIDSWKLGG